MNAISTNHDYFKILINRFPPIMSQCLLTEREFTSNHEKTYSELLKITRSATFSGSTL